MSGGRRTTANKLDAQLLKLGRDSGEATLNLQQMMSNLWRCVAVVLLASSCAARTWAHGSPIQLHVVGGKLTVSGGLTDDRGYADWVFADADEEAVFAPGPNSQLITDLPGLQAFDMIEGQQISLQAISRPDFTKPATPALALVLDSGERRPWLIFQAPRSSRWRPREDSCRACSSRRTPWEPARLSN